MKQAHEKYAKDGFVILGFNSDSAAGKMNDYITKNGYDWSQWFISPTYHGELSTRIPRCNHKSTTDQD